MSNAKTVVNNWLTDTIVSLVRSYDEKGLRASGKFEKSLESFVTFRKGGVKLGVLGAKHSIFMQDGTVPQSTPSVEAAKKLYPLILQWIEDKGLSFDKGRAFAIALHIVYKGIKVPNAYNPGGVISDVVNKVRLDMLTKSLGLVLKEEVKSDIIKEFA